VLESHQKNAGGNARIAETMFRYFRWPTQFPDFVYLSQVQQGLAIKTAVTQWRSLKPHCMGTLIWQLNDTWPVCSWASLDYGGDWKLLHHMAKDFYAPVSVVAVPDGDEVRLVGVNDGSACEITCTVSALAMGGSLRNLTTASGTVGAVSTYLCKAALADLAPQEMLYFAWQTAHGDAGADHFAPRPYKAYDLQPSGLTARQEGNVLTLTTTGLALFAAVEADVAGRFDKNALLLLPGQETQVTFSPAEAGATPTFTLRDLHSATYA